APAGAGQGVPDGTDRAAAGGHEGSFPASRGGAGMSVVTMARMPLRHVRRGKVREVFDAGRDRLLLIATDRVSAFDVVMKEPIPYKGAVLTQMTAWWLKQLDVDHHMISANTV